MPVKQSERTVALLDTVDMLLRSTQEPIHYRELTKVLIESGLWAQPWGKEHDQILYSAIHNEVKRLGQEVSRFIFMGGGIFCTSFIEGIDEIIELLPVPEHNVTPRNPHARAGDMPGEAERRQERSEHAEASRRCGNCTHLSWSGPNLHTHEVGSCSLYSKTRRSCVFKTSEACEHWQIRSASQVNNDRSMPLELVSEAEHMRITGNRPRNSRFS